MEEVATKFNDCINNQDIDGLANFMTENHTLIVHTSSEKRTDSGKEKCIEAWKEFFKSFPDYKNVFENVIVRDNLVIITGHSVCSFEPLDGPAIWVAKIEDGKIKEWMVYDDSPENRKKLSID